MAGNSQVAQYSEEEYGPLGTKERRANMQKKSWLKNKYGLTLQAYRNMSEAQDHKCAICNEVETGNHVRDSGVVPITLAVDHNHETGEVRALLCAKCNKGLGLFNDNIEDLERALTYLKSHSGG